jgi:tRNA/tmRNA/rRNA uracil-C5-methylase (TrmA/RlmC/RlmD family)
MNQNQVTNLLDLFGGNGNLSNSVQFKKRLCVDIYKETPGPDFINQDMYATDALKRINKEVWKRSLQIDHLIVDPPRSGFKEFAEALNTWKPEFAAYVSCDPHTLARDLASVQGYTFSRAFLIDFFPSTFHFESMIFLERKS